MIDKAEIETLEKRLREEYEKNMEAIRRVQQLLNKEGGDLPDLSGADVSDPASGHNGVEPTASPRTLIGEIEKRFVDHPHKGWTVPSLKAALQRDGFTFAARNPDSSINVALSRLRGRQKIRLTVRGSGRVPHTYKHRTPPPPP